MQVVLQFEKQECDWAAFSAKPEHPCSSVGASLAPAPTKESPKVWKLALTHKNTVPKLCSWKQRGQMDLIWVALRSPCAWTGEGLGRLGWVQKGKHTRREEGGKLA